MAKTTTTKKTTAKPKAVKQTVAKPAPKVEEVQKGKTEIKTPSPQLLYKKRP